MIFISEIFVELLIIVSYLSPFVPVLVDIGSPVSAQVQSKKGRWKRKQENRKE